MVFKIDQINQLSVPLKIINGIKNLSELHKVDFSKKFRKICEEYSLHTLGTKIYAEWLILYSSINNEFKEGWIPGGYFHSFVSPQINGLYGRISQLNGLPKVLFDGSLFPDLVFSVNGMFIDIKREIISKLSVTMETTVI